MDSSSQSFDRPSAALDGPAKDITLQQFSEPFKFLEQNRYRPRLTVNTADATQF
jgi:hypothetical protein